MLTLSLLLTIAILVRQSTSINLTYIVKKEGEKLQPNCIAEENDRYSAIGWIYPLPTNEEEEPKISECSPCKKQMPRFYFSYEVRADDSKRVQLQVLKTE